jgi:hypothetical protein
MVILRSLTSSNTMIWNLSHKISYLCMKRPNRFFSLDLVIDNLYLMPYNLKNCGKLQSLLNNSIWDNFFIVHLRLIINEYKVCWSKGPFYAILHIELVKLLPIDELIVIFVYDFQYLFGHLFIAFAIRFFLSINWS